MTKSSTYRRGDHDDEQYRDATDNPRDRAASASLALAMPIVQMNHNGDFICLVRVQCDRGVHVVMLTRARSVV